jgi:hypothetical protein
MHLKGVESASLRSKVASTSELVMFPGFCQRAKQALESGGRDTYRVPYADRIPHVSGKKVTVALDHRLIVLCEADLLGSLQYSFGSFVTTGLVSFTPRSAH